MSTLDTDPVVALMREAGVPVTRAGYIDVNWGSTPPTPWTVEDEAELPEELQDYSWVKLDGG